VIFCDFFFVPKDGNKKGVTFHQMVLTEGLLARSAVPPPWPSACVFQSPYISKIEHLWRRGRMHQGGGKTWHIKMTLFGLYLIRYQPHLSIFESF
jgi:hypothetical protein